MLYIDYVLSACMWTDYFFSRDRSKPHRRLEVLNELLTLHNSINVYLQMWRNDLRPLLCAWSTKLVMRGGCEWELGYSITHVPMYIAFIFPLPRGHNCRPFGSSTTAGPPRKQPSCRSCESPVVVSESKSPQYQQGTYISERISDSHIHTYTHTYIYIWLYIYICIYA